MGMNDATIIHCNINGTIVAVTAANIVGEIAHWGTRPNHITSATARSYGIPEEVIGIFLVYCRECAAA